MATITMDPTRNRHGLRALRAMDGRTSGAKRFRLLLREYGDALARNGIVATTVVHQQLLRRAAALSLLAEQCEAALARGEVGDADSLIRLSSALTRVLARLGLHAGPQPRRAETIEDLWGEEPAPASRYAGLAADDDDDDLDGDDRRDFPEPKRHAARIKRRGIRRRRIKRGKR